MGASDADGGGSGFHAVIGFIDPANQAGDGPETAFQKVEKGFFHPVWLAGEFVFINFEQALVAQRYDALIGETHLHIAGGSGFEGILVFNGGTDCNAQLPAVANHRGVAR